MVRKRPRRVARGWHATHFPTVWATARQLHNVQYANTTQRYALVCAYDLPGKYLVAQEKGSVITLTHLLAQHLKLVPRCRNGLDHF